MNASISEWLKTQKAFIAPNFGRDPSFLEGTHQRQNFQNALANRAVRRFLDPNLLWCKAIELRGILEFYEKVFKSLNGEDLTPDSGFKLLLSPATS
jgi:hypothetical protein